MIHLLTRSLGPDTPGIVEWCERFALDVSFDAKLEVSSDIMGEWYFVGVVPYARRPLRSAPRRIMCSELLHDSESVLALCHAVVDVIRQVEHARRELRAGRER